MTLLKVALSMGLVASGAMADDIHADDDDLSVPLFVLLGMGSGFLIVMLIAAVLFLLHLLIRQSRIRLTNSRPGSLEDAALEAEEDRRALDELPPNEQELYFQAKNFIKLNSPINYDLTLSQSLIVQEKGVKAWEFKPNVENVDFVTVKDRTEVKFTQQSQELSIQTNFPVPKQNDIYYFETKIYDLPAPVSGHAPTEISIGVSTFPYPYFRLPGRHRYSAAYDSDGSRHYCQPFPLTGLSGLGVFPQLQQGDVVGCGIRTRARTIFWTHNGKKLSESKIGGHIKLPKEYRFYPTLGSTGSCELQVNFGQMGYVYIEANVKKWGFGPLQGSEVPPPLYKKFNNDVLLESSDLDPTDLNLRSGDFPPDFYDTVATPAQFTDVDTDDDEITLRTLEQHRRSMESLAMHPPSYVDVLDAEQQEAVDATNAAIRREQER